MNFITGISGFLGSYLAKQLIDSGEEVIGIRKNHTRMDLLGAYASKIHWYEADVLDIPSLEIAMKEATKIYHCAAVVSFNKNRRSWMHKVNTEGTSNVVNVALQCKIKKMIHVSSVAALPVTKNGDLINEKTEWITNVYPSHYGKSKFMAEREAYRAMAEGLDTIIVNPSTILGATYWYEGNGTFFRDIYKGLPFYTNGFQGFVDVRDVVNCMIMLMNSEIKNDKFIINAENYSFKDLFSSIAISLNKKPPTMKVSGLLGEIAIISDAIQHLFKGGERRVTKETIHLAHMVAKYDNSKICQALNYKFIPIEQSIQETSELFLQSVKNNQEFATFGK